MQEIVRILLVEDDHEDYLITRDLIRGISNEKRYVLDWAATYDDAVRVLKERRHDVCLIDYNLGLYSGLDVVKACATSEYLIPFIFLTGQSDYELDNQVMQAGATDFLVKGDVTSKDIERTIRYGIQHVRGLDKIRSLSVTLEKRVEERTRALAETVLALEASNFTLQKAIHDKEVAQERALDALHKEIKLNELKSRFITMASHEFRTPLSTILSSLHLLQHHVAGVAEDKTARHFQRIRSNVTLLTELLNDFLSLEKLEAGKMNVSPENFDLHELVEETRREMEDSAKPGQTIQYFSRCANQPCMVTLDKRHVKGILINLLSNAIKYSEEGKEIKIELVCDPSKYHIKVTDHGIGIPEDEQEHLFELFFRARNVTNIKGTGLGLNIVTKYLNLMGGSIAFTSELEVGSTFTVSIPVHQITTGKTSVLP